MLGSVSDRFGPIPIRTLGCFDPIPFRSGRFGMGRFSSISGVGRFGPVWQVVSAHLILYSCLGNKKIFLASSIDFMQFR